MHVSRRIWRWFKPINEVCKDCNIATLELHHDEHHQYLNCKHWWDCPGVQWLLPALSATWAEESLSACASYHSVPTSIQVAQPPELISIGILSVRKQPWRPNIPFYKEVPFLHGEWSSTSGGHDYDPVLYLFTIRAGPTSLGKSARSRWWWPTHLTRTNLTATH